MNRALLIIDVQVCHLPLDNMPYRGLETLDVNRQLVDKARRDGVPVIFVQHCAGAGSKYEPGTAGWQVHPALAPREDDTIIQKWHPDCFQGTELQSVLNEMEVKKLIVAGIRTEMCVDTTVRRAYSLGYEVELVSDGHTTWGSTAAPAEVIVAHHNHVLGRRFAKAVPHDQTDL